jgi:hypothetical protein
MQELSFAASAAWHLSAQVTAAGSHPFIEAEQLLLGICSLEKIDLNAAADDPASLAARQSLQAETAMPEVGPGERSAR